MTAPRLFHALFLCLLGAGAVRAAGRKVDFNRDTKSTAAETEVGYVK
jgi:hypothetical protein